MLVFILLSSSIFKFHTYIHTVKKNRLARKDGPTNFALRRGPPKTGRGKNLTSICFFVSLGFIYNWWEMSKNASPRVRALRRWHLYWMLHHWAIHLSACTPILLYICCIFYAHHSLWRSSHKIWLVLTFLLYNFFYL